jgi:hypothetical protein
MILLKIMVFSGDKYSFVRASLILVNLAGKLIFNKCMYDCMLLQ